MATSFSAVYNRFLAKITDDMYITVTPEDTIKDLQELIIDAIPNFEFPRKVLTKYTLETTYVLDPEETDFIITQGEDGFYLVDRSSFEVELTKEEQNILAILMMVAWVQRQVASIEVTRMKYTGTDFKISSQANQLAKLLQLLEEANRQSIHTQRLYKRRKEDDDGVITSNWSILREVSALDDN